MESMDRLHEINDEFQSLLSTQGRALLCKPHAADELMVWFLLGGKDVGKSTLQHMDFSQDIEEHTFYASLIYHFPWNDP